MNTNNRLHTYTHPKEEKKYYVFWLRRKEC